MPRGRPTKSQIRQNIIEILHYLKQGYGYQLCKIYQAVFPQVTQRSIYYQLHKGILTKEIILHKIEQEQGNFSWGSVVEKRYYSLGEKALPKGELRVREFLEKWKKN